MGRRTGETKRAGRPVTLLVRAAFAVCLLAQLMAPGAAQADQESASATIEMTPRSGTLYKEAARPVDWRVEARISVPPSAPTILPMKRINVSFPVEMSFNPNPRMPVCPDSEVGPPPVFLSAPPDTIISRCPDSVLGNGTAVLYVGRGNNENAKLLDPVLVIFNGGRKPDGTPRIKVYGYSERLNTGIYLEGALDRNVLVVDIGQLPGDSAVGLFDLNIPGEASRFTNRRGRDPAFVRTTCADGSWEASAAFTLGTRDTGGNPTSPDSIVQAPPVTVPCQGAAGVPRLAVARVKQSGRRLKVTLRNTGTASASGFRIRLIRSGRGRSWRVPVIRPGDSLDVYVLRQAKGGAPGVGLVPPRSGPR